MNDLIANEEVEEPSTVSEENEEVEEIEAPQAESTDESENVDDEPDEESEDDEESEIVEEYEFNFGGSKLAVPKNASVEEVAESLQTYANSIEAAHTKRSQAVAETSKSLEAREAAIQKLESLQGEALENFSTGIALKKEISEIVKFQSENPGIWEQDPDTARQLSDRKSVLENQLHGVLNTVTQKEQEMTQAQQAEYVRRLEEGKKQVTTKIKDFEAAVPKVIEYVTKKYGVPKQEAENWPLNPAGAEMAYKAMKYDEMQSKVKTTSKPKPVPVSPIKPMKGKGKPQAKSLSDIKDPEEYRKRWMAKTKTG